MLRRRQVLAGLTSSVLVGLAAPAHAKQPWFYSKDGKVLDGHDPVAYFTDGRPVKGQADIALKWKRGMWHFATLENRAAFEANPKAYAPKYGGYCAYNMAHGILSGTRPDVWRIFDGRLYLVHDRTARDLWSQDIAGYVAQADVHWPKVLSS